MSEYAGCGTSGVPGGRGFLPSVISVGFDAFRFEHKKKVEFPTSILVALVRMIQDLWARASTMWLLGELGILLFCSPGFWGVGVFARAFLPGRLVVWEQKELASRAAVLRNKIFSRII